MPQDDSQIQYDGAAPLSSDDLRYSEDVFAEIAGPHTESSFEIANTVRVGRWGGPGTYYPIGESQIRIFSGVLEPPPDRLRWEEFEQAALWGLEEVRKARATAYSERIDFPARLNAHVVITGFYNVTTDNWGWATLFTREGGYASGAFFNFQKEWRLKHGWQPDQSWLTGADKKRITLRYADKDGGGIAWSWRLS